MDIARWLETLGLGQYAEAFAANDIDAETLPALGEADLKELGVASLGHRKKLLAAIARLGEAPASAVAEAQSEAPGGEKRQVTIVFADLAGFTELSRALGAEATHNLLNRYFAAADRIVADHGARVDKHIGDAVMAVFGAPVAHGNDPERAVRAALAVTREGARLGREVGLDLAVHTGVASGEVVASDTGSDLHRQYTVTGDSVNLAARLEAAAGPGEVLVSDAVRRSVAGVMDCESLGTRTLKGLDEPIGLWRVIGPRAGGVAGSERPLVGRRAELGQFSGLLAVCREGGVGQVVLLRGEPGIGKSRLARAFVERATAAGFACHATRFFDFGAVEGEGAVPSLLMRLLDAPAAGAGTDGRRAAVEAALAGAGLDADLRVHLLDLLRLPLPAEARAAFEAMDAGLRRMARERVLEGLVSAAARERPRLFLVEDLQWADAASLSDLAGLAAALAGAPALLVLATRSDGDPIDRAWRAQSRGAALTTLELSALRREEAADLAAEVGALDQRLVAACIERADGNPLFLEQLLLSAREGEAQLLPGSIQSLVQARADALPAGERRGLQAACVLGQRFSLEVVRYLLDEPGYTPLAALTHGLVTAEGEDYFFAHALIRDGVYASLLQSRAEALHARAAEWFRERDAGLHARHLDRARAPEAPAAYLAAAERRLAQHRPAEALALAERGVEIVGDGAERFRLTCLWAELLEETGAVERALEAFRAALTAAADAAERCRALIGLANAERLVDRYEEAFAALDEAQAAAEAEGLLLELSRLHHLRGNLCFPLGRIAQCGREHELAVDYARRAGSREAETRALGGQGDAAHAAGHTRSAYAHFRRCVELARELDLVRIEVANQAMCASLRIFFNDLHGAVEEGLEAAGKAARVGHQRAEMLACVLTYGIQADLLKPDEALLERAMALARHLGARRFEATGLLMRARALGVAGDTPGAVAAAEASLAICREIGMAYIGPRLYGTLAAFTDDPERRHQALTAGEALLEAGAVSHNHYGFRRDAMEVCLVARDWAGVEHHAAALEAYTRDEPLPWVRFFVARARALVRRARGGIDPALRAEIARLDEEARRAGLESARPALAAALADSPAAP